MCSWTLWVLDTLWSTIINRYEQCLKLELNLNVDGISFSQSRAAARHPSLVCLPVCEAAQVCERLSLSEPL